jgi:hypothetical protein
MRRAARLIVSAFRSGVVELSAYTHSGDLFKHGTAVLILS